MTCCFVVFWGARGGVLVWALHNCFVDMFMLWFGFSKSVYITSHVLFFVPRVLLVHFFLPSIIFCVVGPTALEVGWHFSVSYLM